VTSPRTFKPGQVPALAVWVDSRMPADLPLPEWVDRAAFVRWLREEFGRYAGKRTERQLSDTGIEHYLASLPWLKSALRELRRGEVSRLVHYPGTGMPGHAHAHCFYAAFKRGADFAALVRTKAIPELTEIVSAAIASLERELASKAPRMAGRRSMSARDRLLAAVIAKLRQCEIVEWREARTTDRERPPTQSEAAQWPDAVRRRHPTLDEAASVADAVLIACRVPSVGLGEHVSAIKRAARRGTP
jgi:hypothetical protein